MATQDCAMPELEVCAGMQPEPDQTEQLYAQLPNSNAIAATDLKRALAMVIE